MRTRESGEPTEFLDERNDGGEIENDAIRCAVGIFDRLKGNTTAGEGQTAKVGVGFRRTLVATEGVFPFLKIEVEMRAENSNGGIYGGGQVEFIRLMLFFTHRRSR